MHMHICTYMCTINIYMEAMIITRYFYRHILKTFVVCQSLLLSLTLPNNLTSLFCGKSNVKYVVCSINAIIRKFVKGNTHVTLVGLIFGESYS